MAQNPRKRQQNLERKAARRKEKKSNEAREHSSNLGDQLAAAEQHPILHSFISEAMWTQGIGHVVVSRELPNARVAVAFFLVDRYCLGVKDTYGDILGRAAYEERYLRRLGRSSALQRTTPQAARQLVEGAVAYAADLGLPPHPDYHKTRLIFGSIDPRECSDTFEYGKDGMPLFIAGPHDTPVRCKVILNTLIERCGVNGFHYLIPGKGPELLDLLPAALRERGVRLIREPGEEVPLPPFRDQES